MSLHLTLAVVFASLCWSQEKPSEVPPEPVKDTGRPVIRRGGPATKHEEIKPPPSVQRQYPQAPVNPGEVLEVDEEGRTSKRAGRQLSPDEELVERARAAAYEFDGKLPNFICDQITLRYRSRTLKPEWKLQDRVQVELVYRQGKEDYQNVRVNGKKLKKGSPEDSGTWSSGEFGTTLVDIMATNTNAQFKAATDSSSAGMKAKRFKYTVAQEGAHWEIRFGRKVRPPYQGALWIDPDSARVLRIEMNTKQLPSDYDIDTVEATVDYDWVTLSGQKFLLPVKAENLACFRGTFDCVRNEIEFRNYRKFEVESQILQTESEISFPEAEEPKPPAKKGKTTPPSITPEGDKKKQ
jgi:hypothetical protein